MQGNTEISGKDDLCINPNRRNLLQSEVVSFFTPVADKLRLKDSQSVHRPRLDIVEEKPRTKTIVVRLSSPGMSEGVQTLDHKNSVGVITEFQPTEASRTKSPISSPTITNGSVPHQESEPNILYKDTNTKRPSVPCISSHTPNRKSLFTNLIRRLSTPRNKTSRTDNSSVLLTKGETGMLRSDSGSSNPSPRKLRRWFTKRMWKSAKLSDQLHGTQCSTNSQPSLTSVDPVLEIQYAHSAVGDLSEELQSATQDFGSAPVPHKLIFMPHPTKSPSPHSQNVCSQNSSYKVTARDAGIDYNIHVSMQSELNDRMETEVKSSPNCSPSSLFCTTGVHSPVASSPLLSAVTRGNSIRSVGNEIHHFGVPFHHNINNIEPNNLRRSEALISQSCAKLPQSVASQYPTSPLAVCSYTPSYLSASVAAFGYSKYYSASKSIHNLVHMETSPLVIQHAVGHKLSIPRSHSRTSGIKNEAVTSSISSTVTNAFDEKSRIVGKMCGDPGSNLEDSQSSCRRTESGRDGVCNSSTENVKLRRKRTTSNTNNTDDQEHWNRSSLIMLAVAHASPRGRVVTPTTVLNKPFFPSLSDSITAYSEVNESKGELNTSIQHKTELVDTLSSSTELPSEGNSFLITNSIKDKQSLNTDYTTLSNESEIKMDGNFYLQQVDQTEKELLNKVCEIETDLNNEVDLNDEVSGLLRTASGKARLLISEKFCQFRALCHQNLAWENSKTVGVDNNFVNEPNTLVTLVSDLDGFWAMVSLQVDDIRGLFKQVDSLRANNWQPVDNSLSATQNISVGDSISSEKRKLNRKVTKSTLSKQNNTIARQQARERLEHAKRNMQLKNLNSSHDDKSTLNITENKLIFV
uniref:Putative hepatoma up-regulated protein n=1 Tax=Schistosoma mansoni TaxID=6183 RepID=A0A3Q0KED5_SCHMA